MSKLLHNAAIKGQFDKVLKLLNKGEEVDLRNDEGATPLLYAAFRGRLDIMALLIERGADVNAANRVGYTPLMAASREGRVEAGMLLLENGAETELMSESGLTALGFAANYSPEIGTASQLLKSGANVNTRSNSGGTPLICAVLNGSVEMVREILRHAPDRTFTGHAGQTALELAESRELHEIAALLRE